MPLGWQTLNITIRLVALCMSGNMTVEDIGAPILFSFPLFSLCFVYTLYFIFLLFQFHYL
jgi:hypothetical protein